MHKQRLRWPIVAVVAVGLLGGCSSGAEQSTNGDSRAVAPQSPQERNGSGSSSETGTTSSPAIGPREVIRTAELDIEVNEVEPAGAEVRRRSEAVGGHLEQESTRRAGTTMTIRVPAAKLDQVLGELSGLGRVTSRSQQTQDVTDQLVDTRSRIDSQRASVQRLRTLMERAATVDEIVSIESELTSRESELDSLERRAAGLTGQVEMATITVRLERPGAVTDEDTGFLAGLFGGWRTLSSVGAFLLTAFGAVLPFAVVLAIPGAAAWLLLRRRRALRSGSL
ncbi:DUF4349 domain-containing protein [Saccharopolyspora sp. K220]|uniref:DUF4349 domain-containing protein n=1 Tax=Saccharopolyspora soli TaxID=2926618 RepID=UPI001F5686B5|nr:DUF4349 domain-containing protein [Saccharopolyspora soli]MCI2416976.1 DUF4349 domain-containing protein [Saccharopolyspora soli]